MHWTKRKALVDEWHGLLWAALVDAKVPKPLKLPITLNVTQFCKRKRDADNAVVSAKFMLDTLKMHGYIPDDTWDYVSSVILQTRRGDNKCVYLIQ